MFKEKTAKWLLPIMALGVVYGDLGTSPLYVLNTAFAKIGLNIKINQLSIEGIASLIIWSLIIVVSLEFIFLLMKADNAGEGGILALVGLIKHHFKESTKTKKYLILIGIIGVALFFGDSTITPAISILSAVQGLNVISSGFRQLVIPITIIIVLGLFFLQRKGSSFIGDLFGPIMLIWFITIGIAGLLEIIKLPGILVSLSPTYAISFIVQQPVIAFISLGAVVLAVTGSEALYADMGHFGRQPIKKAWLFIVLPSLISCYLGESAVILNHHFTLNNPLLYLFPNNLRLAMTILATIATIIASQAVISGAFSLTKQAIQLNLLPKIKIIHTSDLETGQVYLSLVNWLLMIAVLFLVLFFQSATSLAEAFGIAVSGTILIDGILYLFVVKKIWRQPLLTVLLKLIFIIPLPLLFFSSNLQKIISGGWFPILIAILVMTIIYIYLRGEKIVTKERRLLAKPIDKFIQEIDQTKPPIQRLKGNGIYVGHHQDLTPLALHACINQFHEIQDNTIIVTTEILNLAHNDTQHQRINYRQLSTLHGRIIHLHLSYGYHDYIHIPQDINHYLEQSSSAYFISLTEIILTNKKNMPYWQKTIFRYLNQNSVTSSEFYHLPLNQTIQIKYPIPL